MFVNIAVLKETQPRERRVALVPAVASKLIKLGAKLHLQSGAGDAVDIPDTAYADVAFVDERKSLVAGADVVLCVQPPALEVIGEMKRAAAGDWPLKPSLPFIPGHEAIGRVVALGAGVTNVKEGYLVGVPWLYSACGHCDSRICGCIGQV